MGSSVKKKSKLRSVDILDMHGCQIKDEHGVVLATLFEHNGKIIVSREKCCCIGMYFHILSYLHDLGFEAE